MDLLRFVTAGSVDDGKSTLIGRLLYDSKQIFEDTLAGIERASQAQGLDDVNLALLTDGLRAEREQGITIDVAYRYFATPRRKFIMADSPGHVQYTRNMVTGASTAELALILVDARKGVIAQTRRHSLLVLMLGIRNLVLCVNKMDLVGWSEERFRAIEAEFRELSAYLGAGQVTAIPMAAVHGDNIVDRSANMPWYEGPALLAFLEGVDLHEHDCDAPLRFPVQHVLRPQSHPFQDYRGYAGTVAWGCVRQGDEVVVLPSGVRTRVSSVDLFETTVDRATAGHAVALRLVDDIDIGRGHLIADPDRPPVMTGRFTADICWMNDEAPLRPGQQFWLKHSTRRVRCRVESLDSRLDIDTMTAEGRPPEFALNDIGQVTIQTMEPLFVDPYVDSRATGSFILIDTATYRTVGAGMISDPSGIAAGGAADAAV
jgi:bifunctional enzyme CysN/CysC